MLLYRVAIHGRGFTLIEMLVTVIIAAIATSLVATSWRSMSQRAQVRSSITEIHHAYIGARSDARTRERLSGVALDSTNRRWVRFIDNPVMGTQNRWDTHDSLVGTWKGLPPQLVIDSLLASERALGVGSVVFRSDGTTSANLRVVMRSTVGSFVTVLNLLPATGLVTQESR